MKNQDEVILKDPRITKLQQEEHYNFQQATGKRPEFFKPLQQNNYVNVTQNNAKQNNIENNRITFCCSVM